MAKSSIPKASAPKKVKYAKPPEGQRCQEAAPTSSTFYIACGKPATAIVKTSDPLPYAMCEACASHNVSNRGATLVIDDGKPVILATIPEKSSKSAKKPAPGEVPTNALPALSTLPAIGKIGQPLEAHFIKLVTALRASMAEVKDNGDRAAHLVMLYTRMRNAQDILAVHTKAMDDMVNMVGKSLIPEAFEREDLSTLTTKEGDRVTVVQKVYATIPADKRGAAMEWLRANEHGALITETINASSLSAFAKAEIAEGRELPEDIFTTYYQATTSLTRAKK